MSAEPEWLEQGDRVKIVISGEAGVVNASRCTPDGDLEIDVIWLDSTGSAKRGWWPITALQVIRDNVVAFRRPN
jgi:hypothetical protein